MFYVFVHIGSSWIRVGISHHLRSEPVRSVVVGSGQQRGRPPATQWVRGASSHAVFRSPTTRDDKSSVVAHGSGSSSSGAQHHDISGAAPQAVGATAFSREQKVVGGEPSAVGLLEVAGQPVHGQSSSGGSDGISCTRQSHGIGVLGSEALLPGELTSHLSDADARPARQEGGESARPMQPVERSTPAYAPRGHATDFELVQSVLRKHALSLPVGCHIYYNGRNDTWTGWCKRQVGPALTKSAGRHKWVAQCLPHVVCL